MNPPVVSPRNGHAKAKNLPSVFDIQKLRFPKNICTSLIDRIRYPAYRMVLLGPPGVGKGTIAKILKECWKVPHISTGDILRAEVASGSELGQRASPYMLAGLVPDELVLPIVIKWLDSPDAKRGFIFDGFPRTVSQARALDEALKKLSLKLDSVVELTTPEPLLIERMLKRARPGETESTMRSRITTDRAKTAPVGDYYRLSRGVITVDGVGTGDEVAVRVNKATWPRKWYQAPHQVLSCFRRQSCSATYVKH